MNHKYLQNKITQMAVLFILLISLPVYAVVNQKAYQYDLNGNMIQQITSKGETINYSYDNLNQLISVNSSDGETVNYSYDSEGRLTAMVDSSGKSSYGYDQLGRLTGYQQAGISPFYYTYNIHNELISVKDPLGQIHYYKYDTGGRLTTSYDFNGYNIYQYHATTGLLIRHTRYGRKDTPGSYAYNGYTTYGYDAARRLVQVTHFNRAGQSKVNTVYQYDANGNSTRIIRQTPGLNETADYQYDGLNRLTQVSYTGGSRQGQYERYSYDAGGNRLSKTTNAGVTSYQYSLDNRLIQSNGPEGVVSYAYDAGGNLISKTAPGAITHYSYNARNLLVSYQNNTTQVSYQYNGAGDRIAKTVNGVTTRYVNDIHMGLPQVAVETDGLNNVRRLYSYGLGRTAQFDIQATPADASQYYLYDRPGRSVVETEDRLGNTRNRYQYASFGQSVATLAQRNNNFRYAGEQRDAESGLIYLRARYYDPEIGRFISRDPFSGYMAVPESQNMYAYAHNNPLRFVDPSGECVVLALWGIAEVGLSIYDGIQTALTWLNPNASMAEKTAVTAAFVGGITSVGGGGTYIVKKAFATKRGANRFPKNADDLLSELPRDAKGRIYPSSTVRIRPEQHSLKPGETYAPRHHGQHYHVETRADPTKSWNNKKNVTKIKPAGYQPGQGTGFLPGEKFPGAN